MHFRLFQSVTIASVRGGGWGSRKKGEWNNGFMVGRKKEKGEEKQRRKGVIYLK